MRHSAPWPITKPPIVSSTSRARARIVSRCARRHQIVQRHDHPVPIIDEIARNDAAPLAIARHGDRRPPASRSKMQCSAFLCAGGNRAEPCRAWCIPMRWKAGCGLSARADADRYVSKDRTGPHARQAPLLVRATSFKASSFFFLDLPCQDALYQAERLQRLAQVMARSG